MRAACAAACLACPPRPRDAASSSSSPRMPGRRSCASPPSRLSAPSASPAPFRPRLLFRRRPVRRSCPLTPDVLASPDLSPPSQPLPSPVSSPAWPSSRRAQPWPTRPPPSASASEVEPSAAGPRRLRRCQSRRPRAGRSGPYPFASFAWSWRRWTCRRRRRGRCQSPQSRSRPRPDRRDQSCPRFR